MRRHATPRCCRPSEALSQMVATAPPARPFSSVSRPSCASTNRRASNSQKTGLLGVSNADDEGEIYFVDGNVRHASIGGKTGEEAFYQLVTWAEGSFAFEAGPSECEPDIFRATMGLLMEGMRRQDELRRMRA